MSDASNPLRRFESGFQFSFPIMPWEADADVEHLYRRDRIRIPQLRVRVWEERQLVRELNEKFKAADATQLLRPAWLSLGYVDYFFLSEDAMRQQRSPAQLSKWLDQAEGYLAAAITQRQFYQAKLEASALRVRPTPFRPDGTRQFKGVRRRRFGEILQIAAHRWIDLELGPLTRVLQLVCRTFHNATQTTVATYPLRTRRNKDHPDH